MARSRHGRRIRARWLAAAASLAILPAACGGSLSDAEILAVNGVAPQATTPAGASGTGAGPLAGGTGNSGGSGAAAATTGTGAGTTATTGTGAPVGTRSSGPRPGGTGTVRGGTSGTSVGTPGQTGPIIIASVGNYSGPAGVGQIGIPRGVQTWATWVNSRGGLFGRQVQVIVVDDGGDPARYASTVQDLVENRGVVAFVGNGAALSMDGGIKYLNSRGVPVIGSECSRYEWHQYPVFFPECPHYDFMISDLPRAAALLSKFRKFGFVACSEAAGCQNLKRPIAKGVAESGGKVVYQADISLTQIDFTAECRNAQQAGVELMFVGADANTLLRWARSCDRQRFHPQYFGGGTSVTASVIQQRGLENIILSSPVFPFQAGNGGAIDEFNRAVARYGDGSPDPGEAQGWASAKMFELMATRAAAKSRSITPATILAAGHTFDHETLGGLTAPLTFTGRTPTTPNCHFVMRGSRNGWTTPLGSGMRCA